MAQFLPKVRSDGEYYTDYMWTEHCKSVIHQAREWLVQHEKIGFVDEADQLADLEDLALTAIKHIGAGLADETPTPLGVKRIAIGMALIQEVHRVLYEAWDKRRKEQFMARQAASMKQSCHRKSPTARSSGKRSRGRHSKTAISPRHGAYTVSPHLCDLHLAREVPDEEFP